MDTLQAYAMGMANRGKPLMVFDWDRAAELLRERNPKEAVAGLSRDLEYTGGVIYRDGQPITDDYTYLASTWATPVLVIDDEEIDCWKWQADSEWECDTKWPQSALDILNPQPTAA